MINGIIIAFAIAWALLISFLTLTAILASYNNYKEIEAIKSWYPFCEIMKIKIPKNDGGGE